MELSLSLRAQQCSTRRNPPIRFGHSGHQRARARGVVLVLPWRTDTQLCRDIIILNCNYFTLDFPLESI